MPPPAKLLHGPGQS